MTFPFEVPADLGALSAEEFATFRTQVTEHARTLAGDEAATGADLIATRDLFSTVTAEDTRRTEEAAAASAARADLTTFTTVQPEPTPQPDPVPVPVPAPAEPASAPAAVPQAVIATRTTVEVPETANEPEHRAALYASSDVANAGAPLTGFGDVGQMLERRFASYGSGSGARGTKTAIRGSNRFRMGDRTLVRHGIANVKREFSADLRITDANKALDVIENARRQSRLPGGSLTASLEQQIKAGKSLTAAAGWCAPSETIYDLCSLSTRAGMIDIPEVQTTRGGFFIPENGGPSFASIYDSIGDDGDVILTEYDVINGTDKVCIEIPCPDFVEVRMDVAYLCLTGALLQRRGYPEAVEHFSREALVALDHKVNESVIARMVAQSGAATTIPPQANNTDGASQILSAAEIGAVDMRYRHRMDPNQVLQIVLPYWALASIRAAIARRAGVYELAVTDAEIMAWFRARNLAPNFVYDWQDAFSGVANSPGGATPLTALPANVSFLLFPAGTWVKQVRDVVNLDTVYDNALLTQNQFTALFVEDGFNVMKMCAESRLYTTPLNPQGVTGQPA